MRTVEVDSTILNAIQKCIYYWALTYLRNWRPNEASEKLEKGDLCHVVAAYYYSTLKDFPELPRLEIINGAVQAGRKEAVTKEIPIEESERIISIMEGYFHTYLDADQDMKVLVVEQPFSKVLYESEADDLRIIYTGITDLVIDHPQLGKIAWDHKSQAKQYPLIALNNQFIGYAWAMDTNYILVNRIGLQQNNPRDGRFNRKLLQYPDYLIEQWKLQAIETVKGAIKAYDEGISFRHKRLASCSIYGGCVYESEVCKQPNQEMEREKLLQYFHIGQAWSPYTRDSANSITSEGK